MPGSGVRWFQISLPPVFSRHTLPFFPSLSADAAGATVGPWLQDQSVGPEVPPPCSTAALDAGSTPACLR